MRIFNLQFVAAANHSSALICVEEGRSWELSFWCMCLVSPRKNWYWHCGMHSQFLAQNKTEQEIW